MFYLTCFLIKVVKPPFDTKVFEIMNNFFPALAPVHISSRLAPVTHFLPLAAALATGYTFAALGTDTHFPRLRRYTFSAIGTGYSFFTLGSPACHRLHISRAWHHLIISYSWKPRLAPVAHFPRLHCFSYDHPALCTGYIFSVSILIRGAFLWDYLEAVNRSYSCYFGVSSVFGKKQNNIPFNLPLVAD